MKFYVFLANLFSSKIANATVQRYHGDENDVIVSWLSNVIRFITSRVLSKRLDFLVTHVAPAFNTIIICGRKFGKEIRMSFKAPQVRHIIIS